MYLIVNLSLFQTTSQISRDHPLQDESVTLALKVFVPLAGIILLSIITSFLVIRHFRFCQRKKKRGKNTSVVKASEDIQLLDRMNFVNKNPSYFGTTIAEGVKKIQVAHIPMERITLMEIVGEGAFGQVFKGKAKLTVTNYIWCIRRSTLTKHSQNH